MRNIFIIFAPMFYKLIEKKRNEWSFYEGRFVPKKRTAIDGKVWWCVYDTVDGCYSKCLFHGKYKTKRSCENGIKWSIREYNYVHKMTISV